MRNFKGRISIGLAGCERNFEFELPADATEAQIEQAILEAALEYVDYWAEEVE